MNAISMYFLCAVFFVSGSASAAPLRVASYNIKYLNACVNSVREGSLRSILSSLNAAKGLEITRLLPNPIGADNNNEIVELSSTLEYTFIGEVTIEDASGNQYSLNIKVPPNQSTSFLLNNSGDTVRIYYEQVLVDEVLYEDSEQGEWINLYL